MLIAKRRDTFETQRSRIDESFRFGSALDIFQEIDNLLFRALVCEPHELEYKAKPSLAPI